MRRAIPIALLLATAPLFAQPPAPPPPVVAANQADQALLESRAAEAAAALLGKADPAAVFTPAFLAQVPPGKLAEFAAALTGQYGAFEGVEEVKRAGPYAARFKLRFAKAYGLASMQLEPAPPHKVSGLLITDVVPRQDSSAAILADFAALPGTAGFTITRIAPGAVEEVLGYNSTQQFAVGSAFKLYVLDALAEDIARGKRRWSDVVFLSTRSLPSGQMQDWPQGSPVTLATLATMMISISDNTATDMLMKVVGQSAIAARVRASGHSQPSKMLPMLTTLQAFSLKLGPADQAARYGSGSDAAQAAMLGQLDPGFSVDRLDLGQLTGGRIFYIDTIEWFASPRDLVGVMQSLQRRRDPKVQQILSVNSGLGKEPAKAFYYMGFKGGSEEGVLNLTWLIRNKAGAWYVVAASWNNTKAPVDQSQLVNLSRRLLERVK